MPVSCWFLFAGIYLRGLQKQYMHPALVSSVAFNGCFNSRESFTIMMDAFVVYKKSSYLGFAKKASWSFCASSILPKEETAVSAFPFNFAIDDLCYLCCAELHDYVRKRF